MRRNRGDSGEKLERIYRDWHWGIGPRELIEVEDPIYPDGMVEIGRLHELHLDTEDGPAVLDIDKGERKVCHIAFDPDHRNQRIYIVLSENERVAARGLFWNAKQAVPLAELAADVGGRHARGGYPRIQVTPIGTLTDVVYRTHKKGDGPSSYIHTMGEEGGIPPALAVDAEGRLWFAGGSYTCPDPGITN